MKTHQTRSHDRPHRALLVLLTAGAAALTACSSPIDPVLEQAFDDALPNTTLAVYPVMLRDGSGQPKFDRALADSLAERLRADGLTVQVVDAQPPLHAESGFNQAAMFRENAEALCAYIAGRPPESKPCEYALQPEILVNNRNQPIGVHAYIVTRDGGLAGGLLLNSHHAAFQNVNPRSLADGLEVLERAFEEEYLERIPAPPAASAPTSSAD